MIGRSSLSEVVKLIKALEDMFYCEELSDNDKVDLVKDYIKTYKDNYEDYQHNQFL